MARMSKAPPVPCAMVRAALMALRVVLRRPPSMSSATTRTSVMTISFSALRGSDDLGFVLELADEVVDGLDEHTGLARGRQLELHVARAGRNVGAEAGERLLGDRLLLRGHDALERG